VKESSSKHDSQSLTGFLKALVLGAAVVFGASSSQASLSSRPVTPKPDNDEADEPLENRVERVRKKLSETDSRNNAKAEQQPTGEEPKDSAPLDEPQTLWWRNWNNWHNGGWPNWRNGWGNGWHNGGGGWKNGRRWWGNF
jgi:rSAM-associated Gly-rich repeat protein